MIKRTIFFVISFICFSFSSMVLAEPLEEASEKYANCLMQKVESQIKMNKDEKAIVEYAFYECRQEEWQLMGTFDIKNLAGDNYKDISKEQLKLIDELKSGRVEKMRKEMSDIMLEVIREGRKDTIEQ
ncbi:hypothetical protein [Acinetobacter sp. CIP-A165]|uniref:hypothetical protein n=1 Tax=Acinetobacter sp. CIP-A165 TaxID=40373 RepID=UPI0005517D8A|nr:hypothetical protein [Acinetobacter sp. CIP-A165]